MAAQFGPSTMVRVNQLPEGPCLALSYGELERAFNHAKRLLTSFELVTIADREIALQAARNFRVLRQHGVTIRKTIDTLTATRCIRNGLVLLHSDRAFDPFATHLGLRVASARAPGGPA